MKIGDLVKLSAYGRQRKRARWIGHDDIGLVTKVVKYDRDDFADDYIVHWRKSKFSRYYPWGSVRSNTRKDLKYVT